MNNLFQSFSGFALLAGQITGIGLKAFDSSSKKSQNCWTLPFRINSGIISARTVKSFLESVLVFWVEGERLSEVHPE